jgi:hypothetical protein
MLMSQADDVLMEVLSTVLQLKAMGCIGTKQSLRQRTRSANKHTIGYACICIAEQADNWQHTISESLSRMSSSTS